MIKQSITYKDFNGKDRTEDFYFHLSESEIVEMLAVSETDLAEKMKAIVEANNGEEIMKTFKDLLLRSYGERSEDGRYFLKEDGALAKRFKDSEAYNVIFMKLVTQPDFASAFVNGIMPQKKSE